MVNNETNFESVRQNLSSADFIAEFDQMFKEWTSLLNDSKKRKIGNSFTSMSQDQHYLDTTTRQGHKSTAII